MNQSRHSLLSIHSFCFFLGLTAVLGLLPSAIPAQQLSESHLVASDDCPGCQEFFASVGGPQKGKPGTDGVGSGLEPGDLGDGMGPGPGQETVPETFSQLAGVPGEYGATAGQYGAIPSMVGDFFGQGYQYAFAGGATVARAGGDRNFKIAENNSPFPTDRVFFNYHHFSNPLTDTTGAAQDLDRFTLGIEKAFFCDLVSVECRIPMMGALDGEQVLGDTAPRAAEFGNVSLAVKGLLWQGEKTAFASGLAMIFPTGDDSTVTGGSRTFIEYRNESFHLQPFCGVYWAPTERLFQQFMFQWDFDASGSDVVIPGESPLSLNSTDDEVAQLYDQSLMYADYQLGYWLRRRECGVIRGIAPLLELHYTTTMQDLDLGPFAGRGIFVEDLRRDVLNLTSALFFEVGAQTTVKVAAVVPLKDETDKTFDAEFGIQVVRHF